MAEPSAPAYVIPIETREQKKQRITNELDLSPNYFQKLDNTLLGGEYDIVLICDDSTSMGSSLKTGGTRWKELSNTCKGIISLATILDPDGMSIYFLNQSQGFHDITSYDQVSGIFNKNPVGCTPLCSKLNQVLEENVKQDNKLLIIVATDGAPSSEKDKNGNIQNGQVYLKNIIDNKVSRPPNNVKISFVACTDDHNDVRYLDKLDRVCKSVDCTDDYLTEKKQCKNKLTRDEWIVKMFLGPILREFDRKDEFGSGCCTIS